MGGTQWGGQEGTGNGRYRDRSETEKKGIGREERGRNVWKIIREHVEKRQNS